MYTYIYPLFMGTGGGTYLLYTTYLYVHHFIMVHIVLLKVVYSVCEN